jgi:hypothetical protein
MTPKVTGTRREFDDHECCTGLALAHTATAHRDKVVTTPFESIITVDVQVAWSQWVFSKVASFPPLTRAHPVTPTPTATPLPA